MFWRSIEGAVGGDLVLELERELVVLVGQLEVAAAEVVLVVGAWRAIVVLGSARLAYRPLSSPRPELPCPGRPADSAPARTCTAAPAGTRTDASFAVGPRPRRGEPQYSGLPTSVGPRRYGAAGDPCRSVQLALKLLDLVTQCPYLLDLGSPVAASGGGVPGALVRCRGGGSGRLPHMGRRMPENMITRSPDCKRREPSPRRPAT